MGIYLCFHYLLHLKHFPFSQPLRWMLSGENGASRDDPGYHRATAGWGRGQPSGGPDWSAHLATPGNQLAWRGAAFPLPGYLGERAARGAGCRSSSSCIEGPGSPPLTGRSAGCRSQSPCPPRCGSLVWRVALCRKDSKHQA